MCARRLPDGMPTPFGIRRRLKRILGIKAGAGPVIQETPSITLVVVGPDGTEQTIKADVGSTVISASGKMKRPVASGCSDSTCGTCHVEILEGAEGLAEQVARERVTLKQAGFPATQRLGCRAEILSGRVKVRAFELI